MTPAEKRLAKIRAKRDRKPRRKLPAIYHYQMPSVEEQRQNIANLILSGLERFRTVTESAGKELLKASEGFAGTWKEITS